MSQQTGGKNCLPGFGYPLNHIPNRRDSDYVGDLYRSAISLNEVEEEGVAMPIVTLRELNMLQFMNAITDKADWHIKVHDDPIVEKWKNEVFASGQDFSEEMFDYCMEELRHNASCVPELPSVPPPIVVFAANVVKSDFAVSPEVKKSLQDAMQKYEDSIPARLCDWHPFSNGQVLDLVHPSLFPLVYGTTRVLERGTTTLEDCIQRCGEGKVAPVPPEKDAIEPTWKRNISSNALSRKFQWLPSEIDISGDQSKITSYINNLHPMEKGLYQLVEKVIDSSISLWEMTLAPLQNGDLDLPPQRIVYEVCEYDPDPENAPLTEGPQQMPGESEENYWDRRSDWIRANRRVVMPEPDEFEPVEAPVLSLREKYGSRGLQIIVKFANIVLTPEKPAYDGGSWHVEGQLNEHIVATSLFYYSSENITPSSLSFRQQVSTQDLEVSHVQDEHDWLQVVFGCEQDGPGVQDIGAVDTREGRLLTFPNILQHRVGSFKLADPTKPGHRKILALFLVDPNIKIISTAHVPCQRRDWWKDEAIQQQSLQIGPTTLPVEVQSQIYDQVEGFPLGLDEAKALRLELMEERKNYVVVQNDTFSASTFSLCEH